MSSLTHSTQECSPWLCFPRVEPGSSHHSLNVLTQEREEGRGRGEGTRDRSLNQKSLEFCKYFSAYFTRTADRVNTLSRVPPGSWKSSISVKSQFYEPRSQSSPYGNPKPTFQALSQTSHLPFRAKVFYVYHWIYRVVACFDSRVQECLSEWRSHVTITFEDLAFLQGSAAL